MNPDTRQFAVLEHQWDGVHWDFLVEDGPTLAAWAVDLPIIPDADLPARQLPAHRRVYLDYEGPISGDRGSVTRWDSGECEVEVWTESLVRLDLKGAQLVGRVELRRDEDVPRAWRFRLLGKLS